MGTPVCETPPDNPLFQKPAAPPTAGQSDPAETGGPTPQQKSRAGHHEPRPLLKQYEAFLIPALALFLLGNALAFIWPDLAYAQPATGLPLILILLGLAVYAIGQNKAPWMIQSALWLIALIGGSLYYGQFHFAPSTTDVQHFAPAQHAQLQGTIITHHGKNRAILRVSQVNQQKATGQVLATLPSGSGPIEAGTQVTITGHLKRPFANPIPGTFNQARWLASQHVSAVLQRPEQLSHLGTDPHPWFTVQRLTDRLKTRVADTLARTLPSPQAEVLGGIVLGDKAIPVDREVRTAFIDTGLIHVLAASGLNVGIIAAAVFGLLTLLKVPYRPRLIIAMAAVAFYSLLTGLPPSIQRAAAMLEIALALKMLNRTLSPVFLLCLASSLLVLAYPENIASIGFQFSVLTTFGLVIMVPPLQDKLGFYITRWVAGLLLVPLVAQLWIWPLSVFYFNRFPVHTVPLNILAIALVTPLTVIGFTAGLISMLSPALAGWIALLARPFLDLLLWLVQWGQDLTWAQWSLPSPPGWMVVALYGGLLLMLALLHGCRNWPRTRQALLVLLPLALILGGLSWQKSAQQAQAELVILPVSYQQRAYLVKPTGSATYSAVLPASLNYFEARSIADYLRHRHINQLQAVVLAPATGDLAPDARHLQTALKETRVGAWFAEPPTAKALEAAIGTLHRWPASGAQVQLTPGFDLFIQNQTLSLRSQSACLLRQDARYRHDLPCALQMVRFSEYETRLFSPAELPANSYYRLVQTGNRLAVYHP